MTATAHPTVEASALKEADLEAIDPTDDIRYIVHGSSSYEFFEQP